MLSLTKCCICLCLFIERPRLTVMLRAWQTRSLIWEPWGQSSVTPMETKSASSLLRWALFNYHCLNKNATALFFEVIFTLPPLSGERATRSQSVLLWRGDGHGNTLWLLHRPTSQRYLTAWRWWKVLFSTMPVHICALCVYREIIAVLTLCMFCL